MPVIEKPDGDAAVFGGHPLILIGGPLVHQLREWKIGKTPSSTLEDQGPAHGSGDKCVTSSRPAERKPHGSATS